MIKAVLKSSMSQMHRRTQMRIKPEQERVVGEIEMRIKSDTKIANVGHQR